MMKYTEYWIYSVGAALLILTQVISVSGQWKWVSGYAQCSKSCGKGVQYRELSCFTTTDPPKPAMDTFCAALTKPSDPDSRSCNDQPCTTCDRTTDSLSGHLTSPYWPEKYAGVDHCIVTIQLPANHRALLKFHNFLLVNPSGLDVTKICTCGNLLELSDGQGRTDRFCGTKKKFSWLSESNSITAQFYTKSVVTFNRFEATYTTYTSKPSCYEYIDLSVDHSSGFLKSIGFPNPYDNGLDCQYIIHADPVHRICLYFYDFALEVHDTCDSDFVSIEDLCSGRREKICGKHYPFSWLSDANEVMINFTTNAASVFSGFVIEYNLFDRISDNVNTFLNDTGNIQSPNYPDFYPNNQNIEYLIHGAPSTFIIVRFLDFKLEGPTTFNAQTVYNKATCSGTDYVRICDVLTGEEVYYCGCLLSFSYVAKGNEVLIQFVSDATFPGTGFNIMYEQVPKPSSPEWELAFRVAKGGETTAASKWLDDKSYSEFNLQAKSVRLDGSLDTFKSSVVTDWANAGIKRVKIELYKDGSVISSFIFTASGSKKRDDWFVCENLLYAPYSDIFPCKDFSFTLDANEFELRYLGVQQSCSDPDARVWLDIQEDGSTKLCTYEQSQSMTSEIFTSLASGGGEIASGGHIGIAEVFTIWIQRDCCNYVEVDKQTNVLFSSPHYSDGQYVNNDHCDWIFTIPDPFYQLHFAFQDFKLQPGDCSDFVQIEDVQSGYQEQLCGTLVDSLWSTGGNSGLVRFRTDAKLTEAGFEAEVTASQRSLASEGIDVPQDCSELLHTSEGSISSSALCYVAKQEFTCEKLFHAHPSKRVVLAFNQLNYQTKSPPEYLIISEPNSGVLLELSGDIYPFGYVSLKNEVGLLYSTNAPLYYNLTYYHLDPPIPGDCIKFHDAHSASSVDWPTPTTPTGSHNCYYIVRTQPSLRERVRITVKDITIPVDDCESFMLLTDSYSDRSTKVCDSNDQVFTFTSDATEVIVQLSHGTSFILHRLDLTMSAHKRVPIENYQVFTALSGSFRSPNYPGNYPANKEFEFLFHAPPKHIVGISFRDFIVEGNLGSSSPACNDVVTVVDVLSDGKSVYCGSRPPFGWVSTGNEAQVFFKTDDSVNKKGFLADYVFLARPTVKGCDVTLTTTTGTIQSPGFPRDYENLQVCRSAIIVDPKYLLSFTFDPVDIEPDGTCSKDFIELKDLVDETTVRFCGSDAFTWKSKGNFVIVEFVSDVEGTFGGFQASYVAELRTEVPGCIFEFSEPTGFVESIFFPQFYPNNIDCRYVINMQEGFGIQLNFVEFNLEPPSVGSTECIYDYLEIVDPTNPPAEKLCGVKPPFERLFKHNKLTLNFHSDYVCVFKGFRAEFLQAVPVFEIGDCNQKLTTCSGTFTSPGYPRDYPNSKQCLYKIEVSGDHFINILFSEFNLEAGTDDCNFDFVKVEDVITGKSDNFCGRKSQSFTWQSNSNSVLITFKSDDITPSTGFTASYECVPILPKGPIITGCQSSYQTKEITTTKGEIASPGWPSELYPANSNCYIKFNFQPGFVCSIAFDAFDLEHQDNCLYDFVKLTSLGDGASKKFCGYKDPFVWHSSGPMCEVHFVSDGMVQATGYHAVFQALPANEGDQPISDKPATECFQTLNSVQGGSFASPNFPDKYPITQDCTTTIEGGAGTIIKITFDVFDIEFENNCDWDYVQITDVNGGGKKTQKLCGKTAAVNPFISTGNTVKVHFVSDFMETFQGYKATYTVIRP